MIKLTMLLLASVALLALSGGGASAQYCYTCHVDGHCQPDNGSVDTCSSGYQSTWNQQCANGDGCWELTQFCDQYSPSQGPCLPHHEEEEEELALQVFGNGALQYAKPLASGGVAVLGCDGEVMDMVYSPDEAERRRSASKTLTLN